MRIPSIILVALLPSLASASAPTCGPSTVPCLSDVACEPNSTTSSCTSPLDFVLAVDTSSGMRSSMGAVKDFMKEFIGKFTLSDLGPKVALLTFNSDEATALSDLSSNETALRASIDGMGDAAGLTSVKVGLDEAQAILNNASRGARVGYAAPIVLLLSDGEDSATGGGLWPQHGQPPPRCEPSSVASCAPQVLLRAGEYVVLDKPPDVRMDGVNHAVMMNTLAEHWLGALPRFCHRLDYGTSGLLLGAFSKRAAASRSNSMRRPRAQPCHASATPTPSSGT